ncbi:PREDICTED: uncharacterized protein LOC105463031 [Wasmannia auropunctata]|uniref:uncharacterized protein LOC105463031 n=1 Tax=Wasmannia auropunctata TaxID=64793 RepID=UPI0005ED498B|nr:PREDICTED: uncharacterized protein LOC105463031 [Wasmannia auropunctata]
MSGRKSVLWNHFIKTKTGGTCKVCLTDVPTSGNTTNLRTHIKGKHREIFLQLQDQNVQNPKSIPKNSSESSESEVESVESISMPSTSASNNISISRKRTVSSIETGNATDGSIVASIKQVKQAPQPRIDHALYDIKAFEKGGLKYARITNALIYMIVKDNIS